MCVDPACGDAVKNGDETDTDCGGPECDPCELEQACVEGGDCESGVCAAMVCVAATCDDNMLNGTETAEDCGGECGPCDDGEVCAVDGDCISEVCDEVCLEATCDDETQNGAETDSDCGGPECDPCGDTLACAEPADCQSMVCTEDVCVAATCEDDTLNGGESDTDCGGPGTCDRCGQGDTCSEDSDCSTAQCDVTCRVAPTAGFTVTTLFADIGQELTATSTATDADDDIATIEYDWGAGFGTAATHTFSAAGTVQVTQRVTDETGLTATAMVTVNVFDPVLLNETDKASNVHLSDDLLEIRMTNTLLDGGVRSDTSVAAGSGVWYFEVTQLGITGGGLFGGGVATATAPLNQYLGATNQSIGKSQAGIVWHNGMFVGNYLQSETVGYVVDYRGASPIVHIIADVGSGVTRQVEQVLPVTTPVFAAFSGQPASHGYIVRFNFGSDTENHPFVLDPRAALVAAAEQSTADALVMGFGRTRARPHSNAPVLTASADRTVAVNTEVMLTATATDTEDGTLTAEIEWENMAESFYIRQRGTGGTFTFTPPEPGKYPIHVRVKDSAGVVSEDTVMVTVTGTLPQPATVQLVVNADTGAGITLSPDALQAHYSVSDKMAVRANQGIYGQFWYFEARRLFSPAENVGTGLVVSRGSLNPLDFESTQPSVEVNFLGTVWKDLIFQAGRASTTGYYGFAVDYRGDHPIVYIIVDNAVTYEMTLDHVWVPLYPMLYGDPTTAAVPFDNAINFGATAFQFDPVAALTAHGVSTTGFEVGWGDANTP